MPLRFVCTISSMSLNFSSGKRAGAPWPRPALLIRSLVCVMPIVLLQPLAMRAVWTAEDTDAEFWTWTVSTTTVVLLPEMEVMALETSFSSSSVRTKRIRARAGLGACYGCSAADAA